MKDQAQNLILMKLDKEEKEFMPHMTVLRNKVIMTVLLLFSVRFIVIDSN